MIDPWPSPPSPAEPTFVTADTPCRKCQYNLRSLKVASRCPECGIPVGLSVKGDLLCYSEPQWLHLLRRGVNCIMSAIGFVILALFLHSPGGSVPSTLVSAVAAILLWLGAWFLTTPDPSGLGEDKYGTSRKVIRATLFFSIVSQLTQFADETITISASARIYMQIIAYLAEIAEVIGQVAMLNYLGKLALRLPSRHIAARAKFLMYGIAISLSILEFSDLLAKMTGTRLGCFALLAALAYGIFYIMYLLMLRRFGKIFESAEAFARLTWAMAVSPI